MHRHCDLVQIANRSNMANSFGSGFIQTDNHRLYKTPTYFVQQLYATHAGVYPVKSEGGSGDGLDLSATLTANKGKVVLFAVNASLKNVTRKLDLSAFGSAGQSVKNWVVADRENAGEPDVANSFADPERVASRPGTYEAQEPRFKYVFPALSITALEWVVQR